jgi:hypothetical protein
LPIYSVMNTETDEVYEVTMKFSELEAYLSENPHLKQAFIKFPGLGDPVRLGLRRPPDGFRDVLRTVGDHHKKNTINTW